MGQRGGVLGGGNSYPQGNQSFSTVKSHLFHKLSTGTSCINWSLCVIPKRIPSVHAFFLITNLCLTSLAVLCVVVSWRRVSVLTSLKTRNLEAIRSVESFQSQIDEQKTRITSLQRKYALEDRRDPQTGKSMARQPVSTIPPVGSAKDQLRRYYGLAGKNHIQIASMHQQGVKPNG